MFEEAQDIGRGLVDEGLHKHSVVVLQGQVDDDFDRMLALLPGELCHRWVVPVDVEHREEVVVVRLSRIGRCCATALKDAVTRFHCGFLCDQLPPDFRVGKAALLLLDRQLPKRLPAG